MADPVTIARPYAEAVFRLARDSKSLAAWSEMLGVIDAIVRDERIASRLQDPRVGKRALEELILRIVAGKFGQEGRNLIHVLVRSRRLALAPQILELYEALRRKHEGVLDTTVISASPLTEEEMQHLLAPLETKYGRKVSAQVELDPELIGGVRIVVGGKVFDSTLRGKLDALAAALTH